MIACSRFVWKKRGEGRKPALHRVSSVFSKSTGTATVTVGRDNPGLQRD